MKSRTWIAVLVAAAATAILWSQCRARGGDDTTTVASVVGSAGDERGGPTATAEPELPPAPPVAPTAVVAPATAVTFDVTVHHTADPCTALRAPAVPKGYDTTTVAGVTVAWSPVDALPGPQDAPLRPSAIAGLAAGILEEAAQLLGVDRRGEVTIVVDPSRDDYHRNTGAPSWSAGFYDGAIVRLYVASGEDLGVVMSTLRHELMHAQLHASIGCMPTWFNEGMAMYFAGAAPVPEWLAMLRDREALDVAQLANPSLDGMRTDKVNRAYGMSLAMVIHIVEHGGETSLVRAAHSLRGQTRAEAMDLWDRLFQRNVGGRAVLDTLAHKVFGLAFGAELERVLSGPVCCWGLRAITEFGCRGGTAPSAGKRIWTDRTAAPAAICNARW